MNTCSFAGNLCWLMYNWSSEQASAPKPPLIPINYSWSPLPCVCSGAKPSQAPKAKGFSITRITRTVGAQVVPGFCSLCEEKTSQLCSYVIVWMFDLHKVERPIRSLLSLASLDNSWASTHVAWSWQSNQEKRVCLLELTCQWSTQVTICVWCESPVLGDYVIAAIWSRTDCSRISRTHRTHLALSTLGTPADCVSNKWETKYL